MPDPIRPPGGEPARVRLVLVDDVEELRTLLGAALERSREYEVVGVAGTGLEAIDVVRTTQPDLVLLDVTMPVMGGLEALPRLLAASPRSSVVMLSGTGAQAVVDQALRDGAAGFVRKGTPVPSLLAELRELRGLRPA